MFNKAFVIMSQMMASLFPEKDTQGIMTKFTYIAPYPSSRGDSGVAKARRQARKRKNKAFMKRHGRLN